MDHATQVIDAFAQLGIDARPQHDAQDNGADLVLDPDGVAVKVRLKYRSLVTADGAKRLLEEPRPPDTTLIVVADRVTADARRVLCSGHTGYLDLRGRLAIRGERLLIDAEVEPSTERSHALAGKAGLEVSTALLMRPEQSVSIRQLARDLERSPSTVSEILATLRREELIDDNNSPIENALFWQLAKRWTTPRTLLTTLPHPGEATLTNPLRLGLDDIEAESGWALTDSAAAAAYGAPLAFRSTQILDFYVADRSIVRRASTLLGAAAPGVPARASVRVAPVPAAVQQRVDLATSALEWPLAHPLFVALDLAQDLGRGREVLNSWTPDERWTRVW